MPENEPRVLDRWFEIAEREHAIQNPTSAAKIRLLGERLGLNERSRVLDIASGRGGPALILAESFGCRVDGIEVRSAFLDAALERARAAGLESLVWFRLADAREVDLGDEEFDVAMCLGASFIWSGLTDTLAALSPAVREGGHVVVGEPYWRQPVPADYPGDREPFVSLGETVALFDQAGLAVVSVIASSADDWDTYESLHWRALEEWLRDNPDDPDAPALRRSHLEFRDRYLNWQRELLGWALFAGRKDRTGKCEEARL